VEVVVRAISKSEAIDVLNTLRSSGFNVKAVDHGPLVSERRCEMRDVLIEFLDGLEEEYGMYIHPNDFNRLLNNFGLMIVPIEDPTNLLVGLQVDE